MRRRRWPVVVMVLGVGRVDGDDELVAPVLALEEVGEGRHAEQDDANGNQAGRDRPIEEDEIIAVRHDQRLAQRLLENRRDHQAEHQRRRVE